jgi:aquaporin related protein
MCAGGLVDAMFPGSVAQANTVLGPYTSIAKGVFLEMHELMTFLRKPYS